MLKTLIYDEIQGIFYENLCQCSMETDIPENVVKASIQYGKAIKCYGISHKFVYMTIKYTSRVIDTPENLIS